MKNICLIIPFYNEEESLLELYYWIKKVLDTHKFTYQIIFVNDGSTDNSYQVIRQLSKKDEHIESVSFKYNQGKSQALNIGFRKADAKVVITMDADLQDSPDEIPELYRMITEENYDLVSGWKKKRYDSITKTIPSKLFNWAARKVSRLFLHDFNCGLKAYRIDVVKNIDVYGEKHRYIPVLVKHIGYHNIGEKVVTHSVRKYGVSKFGISRFINGFLDLISLWVIHKFSKRPMHFFGLFGVLMFFIGFLVIVYIGVHKLYCLANQIKAILVVDSPWFYIALTCMILGTMLFLTGFITEILLKQNRDINHKIINQYIKKYTDE